MKKIVAESKVDIKTIRGLGFDATCSLAVFSHDTNEPISVTGPDFGNDGNDRNVILWLDHRPLAEAEKINATKHNLLRYVGGTMSVEMEIPKVLWLKNNMPPELFDRCKFFDLADALTHLATGNEARSFCSTVCKQGYVPVGVDGSVKGWQEDFLETIGLGDLAKDDFKRMGGVNGVVSLFLTIKMRRVETEQLLTSSRTVPISAPENLLDPYQKKLPVNLDFLQVSLSAAVSSMPTPAG